MRIARIKIRYRQSREMGKSLGRERNFEEMCSEPWNGIMVEKTRIGYQEGVNSRVVDR